MSDPYSPYQAPSPYPQQPAPQQQGWGYPQQPGYPGGPGAGGTGQPGSPLDRPAARTAVMLLVGVILVRLIEAAINVYFFATAPVEQFMDPRQMEQMQPQLDKLGWTTDTMRTIALAANGGCALIILLLLLALLPFVRRGGRGATITGIVLASLMVIGALFAGLGAVIQMTGALEGAPQQPGWFPLSILVLNVMLIVLLGALIVFLAKTLSESSRIRQLEIQYALSTGGAGYQQQPYSAQGQYPPYQDPANRPPM